MLDLSPEKIMALMTIGLMVLGPQRLPRAARTVAHGLARARRLAEQLTQPVHDSLAEPRRVVEDAMADMRHHIHGPMATAPDSKPAADSKAPVVDGPAGDRTDGPAVDRFDPAHN